MVAVAGHGQGQVSPRQKRAAAIKERIARREPLPKCTIPGCGRPTMAAAGVGLADTHCRYHVQHKARHGSSWCRTYKAADLKPYLVAATRWLREHRTETPVVFAVHGLAALLEGAGRVEPAQNIKRRPAALRARVAFARLREAGVQPERILAIHLAVAALIEDDRDSPRVSEFRFVQVAKATHRLASGTHRRWDWPMDDGTTRPIAMHVYPKSSGRVLRVMGREIAEACGEATAHALQAVRDLKLALSGPHPSHLPGWRPRWARKARDAAAA
jgi:hypothetical protein